MPDKPDLSAIVVPELNNERSSNSIRWTVLILLCCQNAGHALLTRYSRVSVLIRAADDTIHLISSIILFLGYLKRKLFVYGGGYYWRIRQAICISISITCRSVRNRSLSHLSFRHSSLSYLQSFHLMPFSDAQGSGLAKLFWLVRNCSKIILLVILYAISNLLSYFALARVDASAYTVLLQVWQCLEILSWLFL